MARRSNRNVKERAPREEGLAVRAAIIVLAGAIVYLNSLNAPFIFDDNTAILDNQQIRQLWPLSMPLSPRRDTPVAGRPIVNLSFAVNYAAGGLDVTGYRAFNLAIHLLAALTLFGIVRRTLRLPSLAPTFGSKATNLAWVIALIWVLHPLQTETIGYVTQRTESMMGLCYLLTLYCSVRALDASSGRWQAAAIAVCATGMGCKESMVTAPFIVVLYDWVFVGWPALRTTRRPRLYAGLASTWLVLAALLVSEPRTTAGFGTNVSAWTYLLNQAPILLDYLRLTFWPVHLVLDYGVPRPLTMGDVVLPFAAIAALAVVVLVLLVRRPHAGFLGTWCFITLSPTSSIVPIATEVGAERRMYLPLAGLVALVVLGAYRSWVARGAARPALAGPAVAVVVCLALAIATVQRNREYESYISILRTTVERRPHPRSNLMLGTVLLEAGRRAEAMPYLERARDEPGSSFVLGIDLIAQAKFADGAKELERFLQLLPRHVRAIDAREALGRAYAALGDVDRAATHLSEVVRARPARATAHTYLGEVMLRQGRVADGVREFQIAADLQPGNPDALRLLGIAQGQSGQLEAAVVTFTRAIAIDPQNARGHYLLGSALAAAGQIAAAVPHFARAVELDPQNPQARADLERAERYVR
jgi:tetratricopeptide (TPR) repeat protein